MQQDLTRGNIRTALVTLALPIMGTSFMQMSYNLINMIWIGRMGSDAVAAIGTAGFYIWLSLAIVRLVQTGTEVRVSQSLGARELELAKKYASTSLYLAVVFGIAFAAFLVFFRVGLIDFFKLNDASIEKMAQQYLVITALGITLTFLNPVMSCIYNASGSSKIPFKYNALGLLFNVILDPLFIFVFKWGVSGAAIASLVAQGIVGVLLWRSLYKNHVPFEGFNRERKFYWKQAKQILSIGAPVALQSALFTIFGIFLARVVASYGAPAIAAQKVGVQIEAITYMTATGFSVALGAFTGQNYGAQNFERVKEGAKTAAILMGCFGLITTFVLFFFAKPIFMIFMTEAKTVAIGVVYLKILAISQLFMCLEITLTGCFNGLGKTVPPAIMSVILTGARVPLALLLAQPLYLGLDGVWWSITASSVLKGITIGVMVIFTINKLKKTMIFSTESV